MNVTLVALAVAVSITVGACAVRGPEIRVNPGGEVRSQPSGTFCPPGQAKKGNC